MRYRKLRIAWSVCWGVVAVLLCVLWVRSYSWIDMTDVNVCSMGGKLFVGESFVLTGRSTLNPTTFSPPSRYGVSSLSPTMYDLIAVGDGWVLPHWFPLLLCITFATAPWLPRRFSLRTLLIVTTIVAVMLGVIIALSR